MLGKLAYRNTKRNIKDYLIYLITVTASFSLIFAFNLVANSDEIVKLCSSMDAFKNSLFAVNILIIFVICFLINYTTKFMFEKRSKELGTYMLLGIKKKEIAHLVVIENILLGILAFVLAIPIGFLFSQFVSLVKNRGKAQPLIVGGYSNFLFLNREGLPKVAGNYEGMVRGLIKKYNKYHTDKLPNITPHSFRHTYCTNMANRGMNPNTLQYLMGHANITMTLGYYAHGTFQSAKAELERLAC